MKNLFKTILVACFCILTSALHAQADGDKQIRDAQTQTSKIASDPKKLPDSLTWKKGGSASLNFSQTSFSNWSGGGEPMLAFNSALTLFANYKKNKLVWENYTFMAYGLMKKNDYKATKNDDQINVSSRLGYKMTKNWYYSASFLGKTQFAPGYKYSATDTTRTSDFFAPAYLYLSLGLDYKPNDNFSMLVSPLMGKATLVRSDDPIVKSSAGLTPELIADGKRSRYEFGGGIVFNLKGSAFTKRVTYITQLELFSNYLAKPQNVDVAWDFQLRLALTKFISAGLRLNMIYDDDQIAVDDKGNSLGPKLQVKEFFEIGLFYDF